MHTAPVSPAFPGAASRFGGRILALALTLVVAVAPLAFSRAANAAPVIAEFMAANTTTLLDEDGRRAPTGSRSTTRTPRRSTSRAGT